jgi:hypothetical protein
MTRTLVIAAAVLLIGACGDDDAPAQGAPANGGFAEAYVKAVVGSWNETGEGPPLDETQMTCFATAMVDVVGVDALTWAGISPDEFAAADNYESLDVELPDDATAHLGDGLRECDVVEPLEGVLVATFPDEFGAELPPGAVACLVDQLDDQAVADGWAATFIDGSTEDIQTLVSSSVGACPAVATAVLIAQAPTELTPDAQACVGAFVRGNPELVMESFASADGESAATQELGRQMAAACPEAIAG